MPEPPDAQTYHVPVFSREISELASGRTRVVDATLGGGGHAALFQEQGAKVLGVDRDPEALVAARARLAPEHLTLVHGSFGSPEALSAIRGFAPDFILLDLGVSSRQLDQDERGFSFRPGVKLDMRMAGTGQTAADLLNHSPETDLADLFHQYADEPRSRKLARVIVRRRERQRFTVADDLVNAIRETLGAASGPAEFARLFQALRIAVNQELDELGAALPPMLEALKSDGILAVITYHSGEDRIVKHAFQEWARACVCPPGQPVCTCRGKPLGQMTPRKPLLPEPDEIAANSRARSAKLRVFRKAKP
jgi:16S rRNA (cytosine1402-N4)-methyltransferase